MSTSLAEMLQRPMEVTNRRSTEASVLLRLMGSIALGAALLFGAGSFLVGTGALTELGGIPAEVGGADGP